jgi:glycolate oxidase FAD binding subunit
VKSDLSVQLSEQIIQAYADKSPLRIVAGNSKAFYGNTVTGDTLDVSAHTGILSYEPTELVITARAGTLLSDVEQLLEENGQILPFEPPAFADAATLGGTIACNLSGPARAYTGAARDFLLGCRIINGSGEILHFGGEVMKNVAGYDVSRLMAGSMGTLGVLLEVSLKVLPRAETETTLQLSASVAEALDRLHSLSQSPLPITASSYHDSCLNIRLSGSGDAVKTAADVIGGETMPDAEIYWQKLKEHQLGFFDNRLPLWRLSLASDTPPELAGMDDNSEVLYEWGGALRWVTGVTDSESLRNSTADAGGHATLFRNGADKAATQDIFQPLSPGLLRIHRNLKQAFDPNYILNPGKLYPQLDTQV